MNRRRVKITGIGPVTPAGIGREAFWKGILEPVSRVRAFNKVGAEFGPLVAAHLDNFDVSDYVDSARIPRKVSRQTLLAIAGASLALSDATILPADLKQFNCAIISGSAVMDFGGVVSAIDAIQRHGVRGAKPMTLAATTTSVTPCAIAATFGIRARTMAIQNACCGGLDAIGFGARLVAEGEADIAICGGTEAPLHRSPLIELRTAGLTPPTTDMPERLDRPFDLWRTTGVVSEGACMVVLEPESSPRPGYTFVSGYAYATDRDNDLCGGLGVAIRLAIADARLRPDDIEVISAWGPGHKLIDAAEAREIVSIFKEMLPQIPVVSIKGAIGTPFAAAPATQIAAAALGQREGLIPPTVNWEYPDPACPLNLSRKSRSIEHRRTLINSHGMGGVNAAMVLERC